ncbi:MAG: DUF1294 domain-containing protein [Alphaproteobacteria bacterium HGW-Alphaproteobacteria-18]|nr:MAG: DUF1294 domain-containing protein [Alphaproteobacteria bacterium HGW-Alphaproteobacteria-18]
MTKPARALTADSAPRQEGHLSGWNEARGFGFLKPVGGGPDAFAHIRAFAKEERHIEEGHLYSYETETDQAGRLRASDIRPIRPPPVKPSLLSKIISRTPRIMVIPAFLFIAIAVSMTTQVSPSWFAVYGLASLACFIGYALDKRAAEHKQWRVSETILLMVGLVGGWPGAILAQELFRHKTTKPAFRTLFWMSVAINMAAFVQIAAFTGA